MSLPVPVVGTDPGPQYAIDINSCLAIVDQHNHTPGSGVAITPAAININADLPFNNNNITAVKTLRFQSQLTPIPATGLNLDCLQVSGVDLYYNDGSGNVVRMTQSGAVAGTPGSISNLVPPASVSYNNVSGTFVFQSGVTIPANLDAASIVLRDFSAGSPGLTLSPPAGLGADYTITLPTLPASTLPVSISNAGQMSAAAITFAQLNTQTQQRIYTAPTIQRFLSGSGTYTTPTSPGPLYLRVKMIGGGGGGAGASNSAGTAGNNTTFGLSTSNGGGAGGVGQLQIGGAGGTCTLGADATALIVNVTGGGGGGGGVIQTTGNAALSGGVGGSGPLGGAGAAGAGSAGTGTAGGNAGTNSGAGGGGGGGNSGIANQTGGGGGAGGYLEFQINTPSSTYTYGVGSGGPGASGAASQGAGGNGAAGLIIVEEFYGS